jgi:hypothetical protein
MAGKMIVLVSLVGMIVGMPVVNAEDDGVSMICNLVQMNTGMAADTCKDLEERLDISFEPGSFGINDTCLSESIPDKDLHFKICIPVTAKSLPIMDKIPSFFQTEIYDYLLIIEG